MFQVSYILINLFQLSGGRRAADHEIETAKSPQRGEEIAHPQSFSDCNYSQSRLKYLFLEPLTVSDCLNPAYFQIVLTSLNKHNCVKLLFT